MLFGYELGRSLFLIETVVVCDLVNLSVFASVSGSSNPLEQGSISKTSLICQQGLGR
jgi:hypothetical protein